jgi:nitrous oxidase accessory protein NosD
VAIVVTNTRANFVISNCYVEGPGRFRGTYGIGLLNVSSGHILNCNITGHRYGIRITDSHLNLVAHCFFTQNLRGTTLDYGAEYNVVRDNFYIQNEFALRATLYAEHNTMMRNTAVDGHQGISLSGGACNNSISWNTLVNNSFNAIDADHCNWWDLNGYSDYTGTDLNWDGIGDSPHVIETLPDWMVNASKDNHPRMLPMNEHFVVGLETLTALRWIAVAVPLIIVFIALLYVMVKRGYLLRLRNYFHQMRTNH